MDNSLNPIEDFVNTGLAERFYKVFGVPLLFFNGPDVKAVVSRKLKKELKDIYPFARARTSGFALNEQTSYKPNTLLRKGLHGNASHDNTLTYKLSMIPVITRYEVELYVQDMRSLRLFSKNWLLSATRNSLKFTVVYGVAAIDIDVKLDKDLSIPSREGGVSETKEYMLTTNMTVNGYMSEDITKSQAANQLDTEGQIAALGGGDANTQVFLFSSRWPDTSGSQASAGDDPTT